MRILLDTNVVIWWVEGSDRIGEPIKRMILSSANDLFVSDVTLWEIVIKLRVGKLNLRVEQVEASLRADGMSRLALKHSHLQQVENLPFHHRDPFDHLLIAQAISEDLTFVTRDVEAEKYPVRLMRC